MTDVGRFFTPRLRHLAETNPVWRGLTDGIAHEFMVVLSLSEVRRKEVNLVMLWLQADVADVLILSKCPLNKQGQTPYAGQCDRQEPTKQIQVIDI